MNPLITKNFLLSTDTSRKLYQNFAKEMPIIDYHCHLNPKEIAENRIFNDITELWLEGDHYKWRVMRAYGIDEEYITGKASNKEKFMKWVETISQCIGNPLYHWTHLELFRYFGINEILVPENAESIWNECNRIIKEGDFSARKLIDQSNVKIICTTDDPTDSLENHKKIAADPSFQVKVFPAFRPDKALQIESPHFRKWIRKLEKTVNFPINNYQDFTQALKNRIEYFDSLGCKVSDHALNSVIFIEGDYKQTNDIFQKGLEKNALDSTEIAMYKSQLLLFLGEMYTKKKWVMQYHMNSIRNCNTRMYNHLGPDTGYDCMGDQFDAKALISLLDRLTQNNSLPKTILYSLNPNDTPLLASIMGTFQQGPVKGKLQLGSAWWFNDHKEGMIQQLTDLATQGVLGTFIGMLTDSRSFLSYTRHEYFRRILCDFIGQKVEKGEIHNDLAFLGKIIQNIAYYNAERYFNFIA